MAYARPTEKIEYRYEVLGVEWNQGTDTWRRIDKDGITITPNAADFNAHPVWGKITRVNLSEAGVVNAEYGDGDYASDGSNGEVMVRIPRFYVKAEEPSDGTYRWWISSVELQGFEVHPAFLQRDGRERPYLYSGAYESTLRDDEGTLKLHTKAGEQPWTGGELDSLAFNSGSVVFAVGETLTGVVSGATGNVVDWHVSTGAWGTEDAAGIVYLKQVSGTFQAEDLNGSTGGANMASATGANSALALKISDARGYAGACGEGWGIMNIWSLSAVKLLFAIEYGDMDSQVDIGAGITGLPSGSGFAGKETAADGVDDNLDEAGTGQGTGVDNEVPVTYRFMENLWGNTWKFIDGYNAIDAEYRIIKRNGLGSFADALADGDYEVSKAAPITSDGYISNILFERVMKYLFIPTAVAGSSSTYIPDYFYAHDVGETNILLAGGHWYYSLNAGLGSLHSNSVASHSSRYIGARSEFLP